ncbi:hypothetical protein L249_3995 [Ophiocordyceps polyrhachis-furcata BCC 54312]|uniref:Uncharacterized protein n=1 Tax=Ophiocordyceps polyrhachis-furcata BCC 54312 TaxID=1330021 RepID=A0A367L4X0_9HYPO|nr:hypothetical protein L249_3995 [Ophiocordyceps polyrhachis-furcata BCC 54312]
MENKVNADDGLLLRLGARLGHVPFVENMLFSLSKEKVNDTDELGNTALHEAAANGRLTQVQNLIDYGADVSARNQMGREPLHLAVENGHHATADHLLLHDEVSPASEDCNCQTPLHLAVIARREQAVLVILSKISDDIVNIKDTHSRTALFYAVRNHDMAIVSRLLQAGADIEESFHNGRTLLHQMILYGDTAAVAILTDAGANIEAPDSKGLTPLYLAAQAGHIEIFELLRRRGAKKDAVYGEHGQVLLHRAIVDGSLTAFRLILNTYSFEEMEKEGPSLVYAAAERNQRQIAFELAAYSCYREEKHGFCAYAVGKADATTAAILYEVGCFPGYGGDILSHPLYMAVSSNHELVARALVAAGADVQATNDKGDTLLHQAAREDNKDAVELLIELDADVNAHDGLGRTPLHIAAKHGPSVVKTLIDAEADLAVQDSQKQTALHAAASQGDVRVLASLITNNRFNWLKNIVDERGQTALHLCTEHDKFEAAWMLIDEGLDVDVKDEDGQTALHIAAAKGRSRIVQRLLAAGADVDATDNLGRSPAYLARSCSGSFEIMGDLRDGRGIELIPATQSEYFTHLHHFAKHRLRHVVYADDPVVDELAKDVTVTVPRFRKRHADLLSESDAAGLAKLMLYDFVICNDAAPRAAPSKDKADLSGTTVHAAAADDWENDSTGDEASENNDPEQTENQSSETLEDNPHLFTKLIDQVLEPMVINKIQKRHFYRPLIVLVITDGERDGSPHWAFGDATNQCEEYLADRKIGRDSVVFLHSDVSRDLVACSLLRMLMEDETLTEFACFSPQGLWDIVSALAFPRRDVDTSVSRFNAELVRVLLNPKFDLLQTFKKRE